MKALVHPKLPDQKQVRRIIHEIESKDERLELNLYIVGEMARGDRMKLAYWPGCVSRGFTPELHGSVAKVAPLLDLELVELDRANCCGAGVIAEHNQELVDTLNARTFALAQGVEGAAGMMNICSTCQGAQSECQERLDASSSYRDRGELAPQARRALLPGRRQLVEQELPLDPGRGDRPGQRCASASSGRSTGLRIAPFYGCYIVRPTKRLGFDEHPERDQYLNQVIEALGAEPVEYAGARKCCGFPVITMNRTTSLRQAGRHVADAIDAGADCLVTPCPLCHLNLDLQQPAAASFVERDLDLPVLHLPQMVGLALGLEPKELGHGQARGLDARRAAQDRRSSRRPENEKPTTAGRLSRQDVPQSALGNLQTAVHARFPGLAR